MNSSERARRRDAWLRVYWHEINRRRVLYESKPKAARQIFAQNPKGLSMPQDCPTFEAYGKHVWVPATHLWIHDQVKGFRIDKINRRGLHEAQPFEYDGQRITPQMCWSCTKTRELIIPVVPWKLRQTLTQQILTDKRKPRGKKGKEVMIQDYDELFDNIESHA